MKFKLLIIVTTTSNNVLSSNVAEFETVDEAEIAHNKMMTARTGCIINVIRLYE